MPKNDVSKMGNVVHLKRGTAEAKRYFNASGGSYEFDTQGNFILKLSAPNIVWTSQLADLTFEGVDKNTKADVDTAMASFFPNLGGGSSTPSVAIAYSSAIPFDSSLSIMDQHIVSSAIEFTINEVGKINGGSTQLRLLADGVHVPDFSNFRKSTNSSEYVNIEGVLNVLFFYFDGTDYWLVIWQDVTLEAVDIVAPAFTTAQVTDDTHITLNFSEALDAGSVPDVIDFALSDNTIDDVQLTGSTIILTTGESIDNGIDNTVSYTPGVNKIKDATGNLCLPFTDAEVAAIGYAVVNWDRFASGTTLYAPGEIRSLAGTQGAYQNAAVVLTSRFELVREDVEHPLSQGMILCLDLDKSDDYGWVTPQSLLVGIYEYGGDFYVANSSGGMGGNQAGPYAAGSNKYIRMKKSGNDLIFAKSNDLITWTDLYTWVGVLTGITTVYIKGLLTGSGYLKGLIKN